jgi:hypothetical protein
MGHYRICCVEQLLLLFSLLIQFILLTGYGGDSLKNVGSHRNSGEFFQHAKGPEDGVGFVEDKIFLDLYGQYFEKIKTVCPKCFDHAYFYMVHQ